MSNNLISCDGDVDKIFRHSGITGIIINSFSSPGENPTGLTYDGAHLVSCDSVLFGPDKIYHHNGITGTITNSFAAPEANITGLAFDGIHLISCDVTWNKIYKHSGITAIITDSFTAPESPVGLTFDGTNLISCDCFVGKIYRHLGITATITNSFAAPGGWQTRGLAFDGNHLISCDRGADKIYHHNGITGTVTNSFASPSSKPSGLTYETEGGPVEINLTEPFSATVSLQSSIQIAIIIPWPLSAETSMSAMVQEWMVMVTPFIAQSKLQGNIKVGISPAILTAQSELSVGNVLQGHLIHLLEALSAQSELQSNIQIGISPATFEAQTEIFGNIIVPSIRLIHKIVSSFGEQSQNAISAALGIEGKQPIRLDLSPGAQQVQKILQKLCEGDPFTLLQSLKNELVNDTREIQPVLNAIYDSVEKIQSIIQTLSPGDTTSVQKVLLKIAEKDFVSGQQKLLQSLQDIGITIPSVGEYDILLDGISIKSRITEAVVSCGEDGIHNSVDIQSIDKNLFWDYDPDEAEGTSRIEVQIGNRQIYFLFEKKSGDELQFSLWGRSLSAREDSPYAEDLDYSLDEPKTAKSVVEEILTVSALDWECDDWTLPTSFEFEGPAMEGVSQIAAAIGAVVRCKDDGTICIRQRFPVRPIDMDGASVAVNYGRADLVRLAYDNTKGTHYNAIEVVGCTDDVDLPDIHVEESSPEMGEDVHIRVYWAGKKPSGPIATYVTDGRIISLGEETKEEEEAETITFESGIASVSKPITSIVSVKWIGDSGGNVSYDKYSKDLEIESGNYRIAIITYKTTYSRYRMSSHEVEMLLALLTFGGESDVSVEVKMGEGDRPAPKLNCPLLTSESIAVVAGTAWLDANRYDQKKVRLQTPYDDDAVDGVLAYINDAEIDCVGNFHIRAYNIAIKGPRVTNELEVVQCQV